MTNPPTTLPSTRSGIAIIVSIAALIVSVVAFAAPLVREATEKEETVAAFLDNITQSSSRSQLVAVNRTQADSAASTYAYVLGYIWEAWEGSEGRGQAEPGRFQPLGGGKWSVCFPKIDLLTSKCQTFGDFQFAPNTSNIIQFSIDEIPVGELVVYRPSSITTIDDLGPKVYLHAIMTDPDFQQETVVLWAAMDNAETFPKGSTFRLVSMAVQTEREEFLAQPILRFPTNIARYESALGAVRTFESVNLIYGCWIYDPEANEVCNWLNLSL